MQLNLLISNFQRKEKINAQQFIVGNAKLFKAGLTCIYNLANRAFAFSLNQ